MDELLKDAMSCSSRPVPWNPASCAPGPDTKVVVLSDNPVRPVHSRATARIVVAGRWTVAGHAPRAGHADHARSRGAQRRWKTRHRQWRAMLDEEAHASAARKVSPRAGVQELNAVLPAMR